MLAFSHLMTALTSEPASQKHPDAECHPPEVFCEIVHVVMYLCSMRSASRSENFCVHSWMMVPVHSLTFSCWKIFSLPIVFTIAPRAVFCTNSSRPASPFPLPPLPPLSIFTCVYAVYVSGVCCVCCVRSF